ncbi:MAG: NAD(+)/NADH kinase [Bifidobacteriaceae bacterium]|jgi:NAD+ kinase|nr:NAD(+)/NADH kinase [Bifidobacteriaceae bacterium]
MIQIVKKNEKIDKSFLDEVIKKIEANGKTATDKKDVDNPELILSLGGDGTVLEAAEIAYKTEVAYKTSAPILPINLGRVGFLTSADFEDTQTALDKYFAGDYKIEKRKLLKVDGGQGNGWALNEVAIEKANPSKMLALSILVDGKVLSTYGADGIICSTATGSTAHAFSAGGPIIFPDVDAIVIIPIAAHALFSKPIIVGEKTKIEIKILSDSPSSAVISFDGRRNVTLNPDSVLDICFSNSSIDFVSFDENSFTSKVVDKFQLPVHEWRYIDNSK